MVENEIKIGGDATIHNQDKGKKSLTLPRECKHDRAVKTIRSKITAQGQISIPAPIRKKLGLSPGSMIEWEEKGDDVALRRAGKYSSEDLHKVLFKTPPKPISPSEVKQAIRNYIRKKHAGR